MKKEIKELSLSSNERIAEIIIEAEKELSLIQPEIKKLEQAVRKLDDLKKKQFKLTSLIISLKSIADTQIENKKYDSQSNHFDEYINATQDISEDINKRKIFLPDEAVTHVKKYIRPKNNLNYEIFKSVVFNSGVASTEKIKKYLVENNIKQPKTGKGFESVMLKEISSRANYLVRKGVLVSTSSGIFKSVFGWKEID